MRGRAGLYHEGGEGAVKGGGIVVAGGAKGQEVLRTEKQLSDAKSRIGHRIGLGFYLCRFRNAFAEDFDLEVTEIGMEL